LYACIDFIIDEGVRGEGLLELFPQLEWHMLAALKFKIVVDHRIETNTKSSKRFS
jgi:hypothetical protein